MIVAFTEPFVHSAAIVQGLVCSVVLMGQLAMGLANVRAIGPAGTATFVRHPSSVQKPIVHCIAIHHLPAVVMVSVVWTRRGSQHFAVATLVGQGPRATLAHSPSSRSTALAVVPGIV